MFKYKISCKRIWRFYAAALLFTAAVAQAQKIAPTDAGTGPAPATSGSTVLNDADADRVIVTDVSLEGSILTLEERDGDGGVYQSDRSDNWTPPNPVYGDGSILRELPLEAQSTIMIRF